MIRRPPRSTRTDTLFPSRRSSDLSDPGLSVGARLLQEQLPRRSAELVVHFRAGHGKEVAFDQAHALRSEEHTSELQSLMRISYAVFCLKKKITQYTKVSHIHNKYSTQQLHDNKHHSTQSHT